MRFGAERRRGWSSTREDAHGRARAHASASSPARRSACSVDGAPVERLTDVGGAPARVASSCPTGSSWCSGAPALRRAHLDQVVAALWPARARHAPRLHAPRWRSATRCSAAIRAGRAGARLAAGLGRRARPPRRRADAPTARATVERLRPRFAEHAGGARARGRGRAALPAALEGRRRRGAGRRARRARRLATSSAASPATARTATTSRCRATGRELRAYGSRGQQRLGAARAAAGRARGAGRRRAAPPPLMLLDDVMSELDATRREPPRRRCCARGGQSVITTTELAHVPGRRGRRTSTRLAIADGARAAGARPARTARGMRRRGPRPVALALDALADRLAPPTLLAEVQRAWPTAAGARSRERAEPVAERDGVVTVACRARSGRRSST